MRPLTIVVAVQLSPDVSRAKEIASQALTPLDRELMNRARNGLLDAPEHGRTDLIGRLERLEVWGLAARHADGRWALTDDLKTNLEALGERIEINRMLERVEGLALADFDILEADRGAPAPPLWQSQSGDFDMPSRPRST